MIVTVAHGEVNFGMCYTVTLYKISVAMWARASLFRRFVGHKCIWNRIRSNMDNSPQNIRGYANLCYSVGQINVMQQLQDVAAARINVRTKTGQTDRQTDRHQVDDLPPQA